MDFIDEKTFQMIWHMSMYRRRGLLAEDGTGLDIIFEGILNRGAGPDFSYAKLYINNLLVIGDIELHLSQHDWYSHGHQNDCNYDNVVLHVCLFRDVDEDSLFEKRPGPVLMYDTGAPILILQPYLYESVYEAGVSARYVMDSGISIIESYGLKWLKKRVNQYLEQLNHYGIEQIMLEGLVEAVGFPANKFLMRQYFEGSMISNGDGSERCGRIGYRKRHNMLSSRLRQKRLIKLLCMNRKKILKVHEMVNTHVLFGMSTSAIEDKLVGFLNEIFGQEISRGKARIMIYNVVMPLLIACYIRNKSYEDAGLLRDAYFEAKELQDNRRIRGMEYTLRKVLKLTDPVNNVLSHFGVIYLSKQIETS